MSRTTRIALLAALPLALIAVPPLLWHPSTHRWVVFPMSLGALLMVAWMFVMLLSALDEDRQELTVPRSPDASTPPPELTPEQVERLQRGGWSPQPDGKWLCPSGRWTFNVGTVARLSAAHDRQVRHERQVGQQPAPRRRRSGCGGRGGRELRLRRHGGRHRPGRLRPRPSRLSRCPERA